MNNSPVYSPWTSQPSGNELLASLFERQALLEAQQAANAAREREAAKAEELAFLSALTAHLEAPDEASDNA